MVSLWLNNVQFLKILRLSCEEDGSSYPPRDHIRICLDTSWYLNRYILLHPLLVRKNPFFKYFPENRRNFLLLFVQRLLGVLEKGQPLGSLHEVCRNVNIYFNNGDFALHGSDYTKRNPDRLGTNGSANPVQLHQKIYQIDCSGEIVQSLIEHSYYLKGQINNDIRMSLDNVPQDDSKRSRKTGRFPNTYLMK